MEKEWLIFVKDNLEEVKHTLEECKKRGKYHRMMLSSDSLVEISPEEMEKLLQIMRKCVELLEK